MDYICNKYKRKTLFVIICILFIKQNCNNFNYYINFLYIYFNKINNKMVNIFLNYYL